MTGVRLDTARRLPVIHQSELAECGLACLAMIACYHGHDVDLASLRRRFPLSLQGAGLAQLMSIASALDLDSRPLRAEPDHLAGMQLPCIVHWDLNHFVVLRSIRGNRVMIHDPARGEVRMDMREFSRHFTGIALELAPSPDFTPVSLRRRVPLRALVGHVTGLPRAAAQVLALAVTLELFTLALPLALQWVLDLVLAPADYGLLTLIGIGFSVLVLFQAAVSLIRGRVVADLGASLNSQWVSNLFGHLLRVPLEFFEKRSVGAVLSRFMSVQSVQQTLTGSFIEGILDGITVLLVVAVLLVYSPALTGLVLGATLLYALLRWIAYRHLRTLKEEQLVHVATQQTQMIESIGGIQAIKLGNRQAQRRARMANATHEVARREAAIGRVETGFAALSKLVFGLQRIALIWICAWLVLSGRFTAGMLVVFVAYAELFAIRSGALVDKLVELRLLAMHGERIADIALEPPEADLHTAYAGPPPRPRIEVVGLGFRYSGDGPWVLHECSFTIEPGENVAITGPSGGGKTTLAKLLLGLVEPTEGRILVDGIEIRRLGLARYRDMFGAVMQDDALFAGSIADNIAFFDEGAPLPEVEAAARAAEIHDDIVRMPMGYETLVGDMGSTLSGGQKQRVLLARALYRSPPILLLDEATSHLDVEREAAVNAHIAALSMTRVVIAHRPETIRSADRIIHLANGRMQPGADSTARSAGSTIRDRMVKA